MDALGSDSEQQGGGFLTGQFWIKDDSKDLSTTLSSSSTRTSSTAEVTAYSDIQRATLTGTSDGGSGSTSLDESSNTQTTSPATTTAGSTLPEVSSSAAIPPSTAGTDAETIKQSATPTSAASVNVTAIGVGVGLGALIIITIVTLGAIFVLRRRRKLHSDRSSKSPRTSGDPDFKEQMPAFCHKGVAESWRIGNQTNGRSPKILFEAPDNRHVYHELGVTLASHEAGQLQPSRP